MGALQAQDYCEKGRWDSFIGDKWRVVMVTGQQPENWDRGSINLVFLYSAVRILMVDVVATR